MDVRVGTVKKAERRRIDAFELCWRRLLRVPWTSRRSNQSILKKIMAFNTFHFSSVHCSVISDSLWSHGLQHARPSCPSPTPGVCSNSCPSCQWCYPTISSYVVPFSSHLQSFPASGSFPMSQFFASGGQNIGVQLQHQSFQWIFRTDFLQDGLVGSAWSPRDSQESSPTPQFKNINSSALKPL